MKRLLAVLGLLAVSASCASVPDGGYEADRATHCAELTVVNRSWEDVKIYLVPRTVRAMTVTSQATRTVEVCGLQGHTQAVRVEAIGRRFAGTTLGPTSWNAGEAWTLILNVFPMEPQWLPTPRG